MHLGGGILSQRTVAKLILFRGSALHSSTFIRRPFAHLHLGCRTCIQSFPLSGNDRRTHVTVGRGMRRPPRAPLAIRMGRWSMAAYVIAGYGITDPKGYEGKSPRFDQGRICRDGEGIQGPCVGREFGTGALHGYASLRISINATHPAWSMRRFLCDVCVRRESLQGFPEAGRSELK